MFSVSVVQKILFCLSWQTIKTRSKVWSEKCKGDKEMKKVICAVAAFGMVAGVATVASAEVELSGDARARMIYKDNMGETSHSYWDSRVRVAIEGKTESGAYVNARVELFDRAWGTNLGDSNVATDYAYLGFKTNGFDVSAGRQVVDETVWFLNDERFDRFKLLYNTGDMTVGYTYDQLFEGFDTVGFEGDDIVMHGLLYTQKIGESFTVLTRGLYVVNDTAVDADGFLGTVNLGMNFGANTITVEQSWKDGDVMGTPDDQFGGYAQWSAPFGSVTPTVTLGYTKDGFEASGDFSYIMIGDGWATSAVEKIGMGGDTVFIGTTADMSLSEKLDLQGNLVYLDRDTVDGLDERLIELSGMVSYEVITGATLSFKAGMLDFDDADTAVSAVTRIDVRF